MSTSKRIDAVCIVVVILTLLITVLFMNGEALGVVPIADGDAEGGQFTDNDLRSDWDSAGATQITLTGDGGSVRGSGAYVYEGDVHILYAGKYVLSGELADGSVIIEANNTDKIWLLLDGVSLHCEDGAAVDIEQADKVFVTLAEGTENYISSGAEYTEEAVLSGIDGALYSRDDLTINGGGSLSVTAEYKHAVVCNDDLVITGGKLDITAAEDGLHANDSVRIREADITINAGDDGITVSNDDETAYFYIESGNISIPSCYEGIEAIDITIAGGVLDIRPTDDGINANGWGSSAVINITGGDVTIINETGRDADGLDSNGNIQISGGNIFISVTADGGSCALDCGSESGGVCEISGGTVIATGSSGMAEGFDSTSEQCFIMYNTSTTAAGTELSLKNGKGEVIFSEVIPCSFSSVVMSSPELQMGEVCTVSIGGEETEITVDNSSAGGFGGGMFGGRGGGMFPQGDGTRGGKMFASDENASDEGMAALQEIAPGDGMTVSDGNASGEEMPPPGGEVSGEEMTPPDGDASGDETGFPDGGMMPPGGPPADGGMMGPPPGGDASGEGMGFPPGGDASGEEMGYLPGEDNTQGDAADSTDGAAQDGETGFPGGGMGGPPPGGGGGMGGPPGDGGMGGMPFPGGENAAAETSQTLSAESLIELGIASAVLLLGLLFALVFKRRG